MEKVIIIINMRTLSHNQASVVSLIVIPMKWRKS